MKRATPDRDDEEEAEVPRILPPVKARVLTTKAELFTRSWARHLCEWSFFKVTSLHQNNMFSGEMGDDPAISYNRFPVTIEWQGRIITMQVKQTSRAEYEREVSSFVQESPSLAIIDLAAPDYRRVNPESAALAKLLWGSVNHIVENFTTLAQTGKVRTSAVLLDKTFRIFRAFLGARLDKAYEAGVTEMTLLIDCVAGVERSLFFFNMLAYVFSLMHQRRQRASQKDDTLPTFLAAVAANTPVFRRRPGGKQEESGRPEFRELFKEVCEALAVRIVIDTTHLDEKHSKPHVYYTSFLALKYSTKMSEVTSSGERCKSCTARSTSVKSACVGSLLLTASAPCHSSSAVFADGRYGSVAYAKA